MNKSDIILKYIIEEFGTSKYKRLYHYSYCSAPFEECCCNDLLDADENTSLITGGYIDSFSMIVVLEFLESEFDVQIPDIYATPSRFNTVAEMVKLVEEFKK